MAVTLLITVTDKLYSNVSAFNQRHKLQQRNITFMLIATNKYVR